MIRVIAGSASASGGVVQESRLRQVYKMLGNKGSGRAYRSGGTRGGQALFSWEDVKKDKDRSHYLGNSQMAAVGRWQTGKDILWYTKESKSNQSVSHFRWIGCARRAAGCEC